MDSTLVAQFLEATYPDRPIPLTSELGREIESKSRTVIGPIFCDSVMPREVRILSPRSQEYFRRTREAAFGCKLEELLDSEKEESAWRKVEDDIHAVEQLLLTNEKEGQFVLGARPSAIDFFLAGSLHAARMVDESVFARIAKYLGYKKIYEACVPYMQGQEVPDITD
jgi:glutathione S-transferase